MSAAGPPQGAKAPSGGSAARAAAERGDPMLAAGSPQGPKAPPSPDAIHLIETLRVAPGPSIPLLDLHLHRLRRSCDALHYPWPAVLPQAIATHLATLNPRETYRLRILLNPAGGHSLQSQVLPDTPTPVRVVLAPGALNADPDWIRHKSTHRPWYARASDWLQRHPHVFDVLYCNARDEVCEGARTNIYIRDARGRWLTPPLHCGLLAGVQRQALLNQGLVREAVITRAQLLGAQHIRVSNALRGWMDAQLCTECEDR